jgi:hypothetical protein
MQRGLLMSVYYGELTFCFTDKRAATAYKPLSLSGPLGGHFIMCRKRGDPSDMSSLYPDHASKFETIFRMGLKGGLLFSETSPGADMLFALPRI